MNDRLDEALDVLRLVGTPNSEAELGDIREPLHRERDQKQASLFEIRAGKLRYATPIFLAIAIRAFNQLSGINAILYYLNDIFAAAGFSRVSGNVQAVAVGAMNLAATLASMAVIDRVGRKLLLLTGAIGTAVCLAQLNQVFQRPRPYQIDPTLHPVCEFKQTHDSYPSGHGLTGYLEAFTLAELVLEKRSEILARADDYAHSRLVCGVRYPATSKRAVTSPISSSGVCSPDPRFQRDLAEARGEVRTKMASQQTSTRPYSSRVQYEYKVDSLES